MCSQLLQIMKNIIILLLFAWLPQYIIAQDKIYAIVEEMPQFPEGKEAFSKYLQENLQYPTQAKEMGIEGKVQVYFVVRKDGSLEDMKIVKKIGGGCDEEAFRVLKSSPKWIPGKQQGKPVNVKMLIPIVFKLPEPTHIEVKTNKEEKEKVTNKKSTRFIFTKNVLLNEEEITIEALQASANPAEDLSYMYAIKKTMEASQLYGKELPEGEGLTLVYTKDFDNQSTILSKYGIRLNTSRKGQKLKLNLVYEAKEELQIALASSKLKQDDEFETMQFLREASTKNGENKYILEMNLDKEAKGYFLWILEPMSNTNPEPGAFHLIRLNTN